jgi:outer membrane protein assembly factor BamB
MPQAQAFVRQSAFRHRIVAGFLVVLTTMLLVACQRTGVTDSGGKPGGSLVWRVAEIRSPLSAGELAVDSQHVYAYRSGLAISAVRLTDHGIAWTAGVDETLDNGFAPRGLVRCAGGVVFGSVGALYSVAPADGRRAWRWVPSDGGILGYGAPVCDGATVFMATGRPMYLYAIDAITGQEKWRTKLSLNPASHGFIATPRIADGVAVVCTRELPSPVTGMIAGVDVRTGRELWRYTWAPLAPTVESSCAVSVAAGGGLAVGAADDGRIFGLELRTGAIRWTAPRVAGFVSPRDERPVWIVDGIVFAGSGSGVVTGLDLATGAERWRTVDATLTVKTTILDPINGNRGQFIAANTSGSVLAFDAQTGRRQWTRERSGGAAFFGPGVLTCDLFIVVAADGLYALAR